MLFRSVGEHFVALCVFPPSFSRCTDASELSSLTHAVYYDATNSFELVAGRTGRTPRHRARRPRSQSQSTQPPSPARKLAADFMGRRRRLHPTPCILQPLSFTNLLPPPLPHPPETMADFAAAPTAGNSGDSLEKSGAFSNTSSRPSSEHANTYTAEEEIGRAHV